MRSSTAATSRSSEMGVESTAVIVTGKWSIASGPVRAASAAASSAAICDRTGRGSPSSAWSKDANLRGIPRNPTADPDLFFPFNAASAVFAVLLRTEGEPAAVVGAARAAVQRAEPGVAIFNVQSLETLVATQLAPARFLSWLTGAFAAIALTLAVIGIYGMLSYWVRRRTAEIGIRAALGADRTRLLSLVVGQALVMAVIGVGLGAALAAVLDPLHRDAALLRCSRWIGCRSPQPAR